MIDSRNLTLVKAAAAQAGLLTPLAESRGVTIFAPTDSAFTAALQALGGAQNATGSTIANILSNHIINGSSVYAAELGSSKWVSAGGEEFSFTTNSTGTFVTSGNSTAKVVESDILTSNGVVHIIDGVLVNNQTDPSAASSA